MAFLRSPAEHTTSGSFWGKDLLRHKAGPATATSDVAVRKEDTHLWDCQLLTPAAADALAFQLAFEIQTVEDGTAQLVGQP